jgi:CubicO group peptidase (beta-lactamase class C family)
MAELPSLTPRFAPQPEGVAWPTREWPRATSTHHEELDHVVDELFTDEELMVTNAVVVIQGGLVVVERYGGEKVYFDRPAEPITSRSALLSWSMAKSILHAVLGTLVDDGRLDPEQLAPVAEWIDPADPRHQIRLRDLLAMRDGLDFIEEYDFALESHVLEMLWGEGKGSMAAYTARRPLAHAPDTHFSYSSGSTNVLSRVGADQVGYGEAYDRYMKDRLFAPIGMDSAVAGFDDAGVFVASSFVHANALDYAKFGLLYLRGGEWEGRPVISRGWAATAQVPYSVDEDGSYYSWQWWVTGDQYGTYGASGYEGQRITVVPALDAVIVRLGRTPEQNYPALSAWRDRVLDVLAR